LSAISGVARSDADVGAALGGGLAKRAEGGSPGHVRRLPHRFERSEDYLLERGGLRVEVESVGAFAARGQIVGHGSQVVAAPRSNTDDGVRLIEGGAAAIAFANHFADVKFVGRDLFSVRVAVRAYVQDRYACSLLSNGRSLVARRQTPADRGEQLSMGRL